MKQEEKRRVIDKAISDLRQLSRHPNELGQVLIHGSHLTIIADHLSDANQPPRATVAPTVTLSVGEIDAMEDVLSRVAWSVLTTNGGLSPGRVRSLCELARIGLIAKPAFELMARLKQQERDSTLTPEEPNDR